MPILRQKSRMPNAIVPGEARLFLFGPSLRHTNMYRNDETWFMQESNGKAWHGMVCDHWGLFVLCRFIPPPDPRYRRQHATRLPPPSPDDRRQFHQIGEQTAKPRALAVASRTVDEIWGAANDGIPGNGALQMEPPRLFRASGPVVQLNLLPKAMVRFSYF